jgi:N-acetylglucosaminyldiphosphoundecaprenol N-acetyl-beta-D-mannosaminyltransferase
MGEWISSRSTGHTVIVANTHVLMESRQNPNIARAVQAASLVVPDGMPLVVVARWRGFRLKSRSDGPGLMLKALSEESANHWRHYLYGSTPEVLSTLRAQFPSITFAGMYAPPFRSLTPSDDDQVVAEINDTKAVVLWVGLGCPKQETWMFEHADRLNIPVILGVGQAFNILARVKQRAPRWMQNFGLEWLYRLLQEPRRLWKRYLFYNPWFILLVLREQVSLLFHRELS